MKKYNFYLHDFLTGAAGYLAGVAAAFVLIWVVSMLGLVGWLVRLVAETQPLIRLLAIPVFAGLVLALAGGLLGGVGGWSLGKILGIKQKRRQVIGSAIAFAISFSVIVLVFLLLIGFIGIYNNFTTNQVEKYGLVFGLVWMIFGLVTGILLALLNLRLRSTWTVIFASTLGFGLGGIVMGLLVRAVNPTSGFQTTPILTWIVLILALAFPFALGGGALGIAYGRLGKDLADKGQASEIVQPSAWQTGILAGIGIVAALILLGNLGHVAEFLRIKPGNLQSQIAPVTDGVHWSEPIAYFEDAGPYEPPEDGQAPTSVIGNDQVVHTAWCSAEGIVQYQQGVGTVEQIDFPGCSRSPVIALDSENLPHLVWYTTQIRDATGTTRTESLLVDSIRNVDGWSEPAIITSTTGEAVSSLSVDSNENLVLIWEESDKSRYYAVLETYACDNELLSEVEQAGFQSILSGETRPQGAEIPYCRNRFERIIYTPNPEPEYSDQPATPDGAFDQIATSLIANSEYEVLFTTMMYDPSTSPPSPGNVLAEGVARLYQNVKENPSQYPRGMTVRILLGNYPAMANLTWGEQIKDAISDLRQAGVEKMIDPEIGWRLEVANFPGVYPHSHTKFVVIDGKGVAGVGFNYGYLHLPKDHPSGLGFDLLDLGLSVKGPVAQDAVSSYDDMWAGANQLHCEDFFPEDGSDWKDTCKEVTGIADHVPEVLRYYLPPESRDHSFSLYRNSAFKEADQFIAASLAASKKTIDMMEVNFSLEMICMANIIFPDTCTIDDALPWMDAMLEAIKQNKIKVRVIMENTNSNGLENRVSGVELMEELERLGLAEQVELRFYNGKIHAKSMLIDDAMLVIGSQNMHYSSWGEGGLNEYNVTTNNPQAIDEYKALFETKWAEAIPFEEAEYAKSP